MAYRDAKGKTRCHGCRLLERNCKCAEERMKRAGEQMGRAVEKFTASTRTAALSFEQFTQAVIAAGLKVKP